MENLVDKIKIDSYCKKYIKEVKLSKTDVELAYLICMIYDYGFRDGLDYED